MRGSAHHLLNWDPVQRCLPAGPHCQPQRQMPGAQQPAPSSPSQPRALHSPALRHREMCTPPGADPCGHGRQGRGRPGGAASCGHSSGASETMSTHQTKS